MTEEELQAMLGELDEPFEDSDGHDPFPLSQAPCRETVPLWPTVTTPMGQEIVDPEWLDEPTVVMTGDQIQELLRVDSRPTVRCMQAVVPPSSRRPPEELVSVAGEEGEERY